MSHFAGNIADIGMDTISLSGTLPMKLRAVKDAGFSQIMLMARDLTGHAEGVAAAIEAVRASGLRVTGFQVLRDFEGLSGNLHDYKIDIAKSMLEMCAALGSKVLLVCSSTSIHATADRDILAKDLRKLAMLALPLGIKVAYEGLSWGRHVNEFTHAWDVVCRADAPNLGLGFDSFHVFATKTSLEEIDALDPGQDFPGAAGRLHVAGNPLGRGTHHHRPHLPRVPGRGRAQRAACRNRDASGPARLPGRLQFRGIQRRLPANAAGHGRGTRVSRGAVAGRGGAEALGADARPDADGATIMIGGFGGAGQPAELIDALIAQGARDLTIVNNNAGNGDNGLAALLKAGRVRKIICSFPRQADSHVFDGLYRAGKIELELVPQGNLAERIRAAGAGIGAFFTPTGYGTAAGRGQGTARDRRQAITCSSTRSTPTWR